MSFGGAAIHTEEQRVLSLRVNQSAYGGAKTRVWGKCRVPGNLLDYMDFKAIPHTTTQSSGGKGGGGVTSSNTGYTYTAGILIGLCTGPIAGAGRVWQNKDITTPAALGLTLKTGALRQAVWSHLAANYPARAVSYSGIAFVANNAFDLGSSPNQPNLSFEVFGERIIPGGDDAAAADVIYDIVADPVEGIGLAAGVLADTSDYALWCSAMGLSVSVGATSQRSSRELIAQLLKATMAEAVWSSGQIRIVPYGDEPVGAWTPNTTPVHDLTESDFLEPPRHKRTQPADAINRVTLNYTSRAKDYNTVTVMRDDLVAVTQYGPRPETLDLLCITRDEMAVVVCEFWRNRGLYIRNQWECVVDERFCLVEAMDLLTLTFGQQHLDHVAVCVVETTDDGAGRITMLVEEWPFGLLKATAIPTQAISGHMPDFNVAPGAVNAPVIFDAPLRGAATGYEVWAAVAGSGELWGGANVHVSLDNATYKKVGAVHGRARYGTLTATLPAAADPDLTNSCAVDLTTSLGELTGGTRADADNLLTLCYVGGELISYESATLTDAHRYTLGTCLRRGVYGTVISEHAIGDDFVRIDDALFRYAYDSALGGQQIWLKFQSFNVYGGALEDLSAVTAYSYTIGGPLGAPADVASLSAVADLAGIELQWPEIADADRDNYAICKGPAWSLDHQFYSGSRARLAPAAAGSHTFRIKARDTGKNYSINEATATVVVSAPATPAPQAAIVDGQVALSWPDSTTTHQVENYEVRYGASFEVSTFAGQGAALGLPVAPDWVGTRRFWVRATDIAGNLSSAGYVDVALAVPAAAAMFTGSLIGVKCQLAWSTAAADLPIVEYKLSHGATYEASTYYNSVSGTSLRVPADWLGARTWWLVAIDKAGNPGTPASVEVTINAPAAPVVTAAFVGDLIQVNWTVPTASLPIDVYEVRHGASFAAGTSLGTIKGNLLSRLADWLGARTFWVAAIDLNGNVGTAGSVAANVSAAAAPTVTAQVIDNNVLLYWSQVAGTLPTRTYEWRSGASWATATPIGTKSGGFTSVFETQEGVYTYWCAAIDSAGNYGTPGAASVNVAQPPDYILKADYDSNLGGTKSNMALHGDSDASLIGPIDATETYAAHFTSNGWTTPQQQIDAGYPVYIQPNLSPAYYEETVDYGTVLASNRITVTPTVVDIVGAVVKTCKISVSPDNAAWTDYNDTWQVYATSFRYVKVRITFTASNNTDLIELVGLNIRLDSKLKTVTKMVSCAAADSGGTTVYLTDDWTATGNKLFIDVDAIALTPQGTTPVTPMYDFTDAPDPLSLKILLFDNAGARVSGTCSMTVRGF